MVTIQVCHKHLVKDCQFLMVYVAAKDFPKIMYPYS